MVCFDCGCWLIVGCFASGLVYISLDVDCVLIT